jgi:hypothetical protein
LICRATDFEKRAETVSLRPWQWDMLFALDGRTPLVDVARGAGIDMDVASEALRSLHEQGLVVVRSVRIDEYRQGVAPFALPITPKAQPSAEDAAGRTSAETLRMPPMPAMPRTESAATPVSGGIAFSLKAPSPGAVPEGKSAPSHGSIGFKIK